MSIAKLQPHRSMYLRGFDRRGAAAAMHNASAAGFTLSGCWSDQADFAVAVLFDADDVYGHLFTSRYLPDFSLAGVTLDFDLAWTGCQNPTSSKYPSVAWGSLSYITRSVAGGVVTETPGTVALPVTTTTGGAQASCTYTVNGTPAAYDRVQLVYLGNVLFDLVVPVWTGSASIAFSFWNYLGTGYSHTITIGTQTYTHVQLATDGSGDIAIALANLINAAPDPNATAVASSNNVTLTPKLNTGASVTCSASDGNASGTLLEITSATAWVAGQLVAQINANTVLQATQTGSTFTVQSRAVGLDGNGIELLEMHKTTTCYLTPAGASKLIGGTDPTSIHVHMDFSALGLATVRQLWLTFAPPLTYDAGTVNPSLVAFATQEWSAVFSNLAVDDPGGVTPLKIAGPGSVTITSVDSWATRAGSGWTQVAGWYAGGFAFQSVHAGDTVTVKYSCQFAHNLYWGTALSTVGGAISASVDGGAAIPVSAYSTQSSGTPTAGRRLIASGVAAGSHTVVLTVASGTCIFDFLQAAVLSDPVAPATSYSGVGCACDFDTGQTYQIAPARLLWTLNQAGLNGDIDFYVGVFFALKRARNGGNFHQATVTLSGTINPGNSFGVGADTVWMTVGGTFPNSGTTVSGATTTGANPSGGGSLGGTVIGAVAYPADTLSTLAQRMVDAINGTFVGICAAPAATAGQFTITVLSPINGFSLDLSVSTGAGIAVAVTGDIGSTAMAGGNEGTWAVDASQSSPLNRAFKDYLTDLATLVKAAGQTMTVAFSQELLAPPDANTSAGAWCQRFANGASVLTATGFGSWGAGVVDGVSGSGPQTIEQIGHGYVTGNTVHIAQGSNGAVWSVTVTDANHYQLTTLVSGTAYTVAPGATTLIDLQTAQCCFNSATVTAYLEKCYLQAAGILAAAGLVPWLQFGEVGWWFYSRLMNEAVGYASWTAPISIGTVAAHGLASGQTAIVAAVQGATAANGTWPITVTDSTHFTETGSTGNAAYVAGGSVSGGGMAYYDAYTAAAALTALGRALASFWTQDDNPNVNSFADASFLRGQVYNHMHAIALAVKAAYAGAKIEWLLPLDTNNPTVYWNAGYPYPQGGRMNNYVNIPSQYMAPNGDIDRVKLESLSWGASYLNIDLAKVAMAYGFTSLTYPKSATAVLIPWFNGACAWAAQYLAAANAGMPIICFWAVDHLTLLSWPLPPLPANRRTARLF
jgi:hypothetical protein